MAKTGRTSEPSSETPEPKPSEDFPGYTEAQIQGLADGLAEERDADVAKAIRDSSSCINCHFSAYNGLALVCRRGPPRIVVLPGDEAERWRLQGQSVPNGMVALFPIVGYDTWCGEHAPGDPAILPLPAGAKSGAAASE